MSVELKIKAKSLAAESTMIRQEEIKLKKSARYNMAHNNTETADLYAKKRLSLYEHRVIDVRSESRATNLARAYLNGLPYEAVERNTRLSGEKLGRLVKRTTQLVKKYGDKPVSTSDIMGWISYEQESVAKAA